MQFICKMQKPPLHVIAVWMQDPLAGFGDLLRGTMHLCHLSQQLHFTLTIDAQMHPVCKHLLLQNAHDHSEYVIQNKHAVHRFINGDKQELFNVITNAIHAGQTHPLLIFSNLTVSMNVIPNIQTKSYIRNILTPTQAFKTTFNCMCTNFKINRPYTVIHIRMGDEDLVHNTVIPEKYKNVLNIIDTHTNKRNNQTNVHIISDSWNFKQHLGAVRPHLANRIIPTKPVHLSHSTEADADMIKDTLFDLYLLMNATAIKTYTNYTWVSGFVQWVSHAFNVPLIRINPEFCKMNASMPPSLQQRQPRFGLSSPMHTMQYMQPAKPVASLKMMQLKNA